MDNLKIKLLKISVKIMIFDLISLLLEHPKKWCCRKKELFSSIDGKNHNPHKNVVKHFWKEVVNTTCYIKNICCIKPILNKYPYEF